MSCDSDATKLSFAELSLEGNINVQPTMENLFQHNTVPVSCKLDRMMIYI